MFSHEKLTAYQKALKYNAWVSQILESVPKRFAVWDQLDRAATSMVLNMAEGNAKFSKKDRSRYWQIAHGSTVECAACLDILVVRGHLKEESIGPGKELLEEVVRIIYGLLDRLGITIEEPPAIYNPPHVKEQEQDQDDD